MLKHIGLDVGEQKNYGGETTLIEYGKIKTFLSVVWLPEFDWVIERMTALAHELLHCCYNIFDKIGMETKNEHSLIYYFEMLYGYFLNKLSKVYCKKKRK
jgi:hypothetical protein